MAAGLRIDSDKVADFTEAFVHLANNWLSGSVLNGRVDIDCEVDLSGLNESTVQAIRNLGPFGVGNRKPVFATSWLELADEPRCVGRSGEHLQLALRQQDAVMKGIAFGAAGQADALKEFRRCRVAFEPIVNEFNGRRRVELQVIDFKYPKPS
jgi:single-stranded-DNA-specific exonuclease